MESEDIKTMTELMIEEQQSDYYVRIKEALDVVLDFVERHNKQDYEREVAHAAQFLSEIYKVPPLSH